MRKILIVCALSYVLTLLCAPSIFAQEESWSLVGSWINKDYDHFATPSARVVYGGDGQLTTYKLLSDTSPSSKTVFMIEESWTEKGVRWFKVKIPTATRTMYEMDKLTEGGNTFESVFCMDKYPLSFETKPPSCYYTIRYRE